MNPVKCLILIILLYLMLLDSECQSVESTKSRTKRSWLEQRATFLPGLNFTYKYQNLNLTPPYADGKECSSGGDPYTTAEAEMVKNYFNTGAGKNTSSLNRNYKLEAWKKWSKAIDDEWKAHCISMHCYLNEATQRLTCGLPPDTAYPDGTSCLDGTNTSILLDMSARRITKDRQEKLNDLATTLYGRNCKANRCYYDSEARFYRCSSTFVHPLPVFILTLCGLSFLESRMKALSTDIQVSMWS